MKKLMIFPVLAFLTIGYLKAEDKIEQNNEYTKIDENLNEWVLVKEDKGIKVYFSIFKESEDINLLRIKFENTLNQDVKMYWTLKKVDKNIFENVELIINKNSIYQVDYSTMMVSLTNDDLLRDFEVIFHKN